ncbi:MAG TPA: hypothetical protein VHQ86_04250 [Candidatus Saccharimonadia bacterium]|nr:hypothetical protein [Candidatus Saccharimonadia bacterium]
MTSRTRRIIIVALLGGLLTFVAVATQLVGVSHNTAPIAAATPSTPGGPSTSPSPVPSPEPKIDCEDAPLELPPHFYGNDTANNNFGSTLYSKYSSVEVGELLKRYCGNRHQNIGGDPLLMLTHMGIVDRFNPNDANRMANWRSNYTSYNSRVQWHDITATVMPAGKYITMYMKADSTGKLVVHAQWITYSKPSDALIVPVMRLDGSIYNFVIRDDCGGQPMLTDIDQVPPGMDVEAMQYE